MLSHMCDKFVLHILQHLFVEQKGMSTRDKNKYAITCPRKSQNLACHLTDAMQVVYKWLNRGYHLDSNISFNQVTFYSRDILLGVHT